MHFPIKKKGRLFKCDALVLDEKPVSTGSNHVESGQDTVLASDVIYIYFSNPWYLKNF